MLKQNFKKSYVVILVLIVLFITCSKDSTQFNQVPPELPPESTFIIDFSNFSTNDNVVLPKMNEIQLLSRENWGWAAANVLVWSTILYVNLAVPVAAFKAAFLNDPVQQPNGTWVWTYHFTVGQDTLTAELHGTRTSQGTEWKMYISKSGGFNKFLWYTGMSDLNYFQGNWTIYKHPSDPVEFIGIVWHRNVQDSTADIKYTHLGAGLQPPGSYIEYGITNQAPYDAFYNIFSQSANNHVDIEWNRETHEGRVRDPLHFGNSSWHCWNEMLEDIECPI